MASLKQLHELVHSLDKNEKKHLSIMVDAVGGKARARYARALRVLNTYEDFDADKLKQKLSEDLSGMNLSEANSNLYAFICRALTSQNTTATGNLGLLKELILVETLISKGLYDHAEAQLKPVMERLKSGNSFGLLSRGLELQSILSANLPATKFDYDGRIELMDERVKKAKEHLEYLDVMRLNIRLTAAAQKVGDPRQESHKKLYEDMYKSPVCQLSMSAVSLQTFTMYGPLRTDILRLAEGNQAAIKECLLALQEFHKRFQLRDHYTSAFYLLDNLASDYVREKDAEGIAYAVGELKKLLPFAKQVGVLQKIEAKIVFSELSRFIIVKDYTAGVSYLNHCMLQKNKATWSEAPLAYMNYLWGARLHYLNNDPNAALDYLVQLQDNEKSMRASMYIGYRFLFLLCHYKLRNFQFLHYATSSIYKNLKKLDKLYLPEKALLKFVQDSSDFDKVKTELRKLYTTFCELETDPYNKPFFEFGDYIEWLKMELGQ